MGTRLLPSKLRRESISCRIRPLPGGLWASRYRGIGRHVSTDGRPARSSARGDPDSARRPANHSGSHCGTPTGSERAGIGVDQGTLRPSCGSLALFPLVVSSAMSILRPARSQSPPFDVVFRCGAKPAASCREAHDRTRPVPRSRGYLLSDAARTRGHATGADKELESSGQGPPGPAGTMADLGGTGYYSEPGTAAPERSYPGAPFDALGHSR